MATKGELCVLAITLLLLQFQAEANKREQVKKSTELDKAIQLQILKEGKSQELSKSSDKKRDASPYPEVGRRGGSADLPQFGLWGKRQSSLGLWGKRQIGQSMSYETDGADDKKRSAQPRNAFGLWGKRSKGLGLWGRSGKPQKIGLWGKRDLPGLWGRSAKPGKTFGLWGRSAEGDKRDTTGMWGRSPEGDKRDTTGMWGRSPEHGHVVFLKKRQLSGIGLWGGKRQDSLGLWGRSADPPAIGMWGRSAQPHQTKRK